MIHAFGESLPSSPSPIITTAELCNLNHGSELAVHQWQITVHGMYSVPQYFPVRRCKDNAFVGRLLSGRPTCEQKQARSARTFPSKEAWVLSTYVVDRGRTHCPRWGIGAGTGAPTGRDQAVWMPSLQHMSHFRAFHHSGSPCLAACLFGISQTRLVIFISYMTACEKA